MTKKQKAVFEEEYVTQLTRYFYLKEWKERSPENFFIATEAVAEVKGRKEQMVDLAKHFLSEDDHLRLRSIARMKGLALFEQRFPEHPANQ